MEDELCNFIFLLIKSMFQVRKDCWNVTYIQSYAIYTKNICKACFPDVSISVVPWRSVSCDNLQDGSI